MTLGQLRIRLMKQFPGLDPDILDGFIMDRYSEILHELSWTRIETTAILQTTAVYEVGTAVVTQGSDAVTTTGGFWDVSMTGRGFRITPRTEIYEFTYVSPFSGNLDRPYEGPTDPAAVYKIFQFVYPLPDDCRLVDDGSFHPLERVSHDTGTSYGDPTMWQSYMDDKSNPPRMQIKLYPIPTISYGIPFTYTAEAPPLPGSASVAFAPWMEPSSAMFEGVAAKIWRIPRFLNLAAAQLCIAEAEKALKTMRANDSERMGTTRLEMADYWTRHRPRRWL